MLTLGPLAFLSPWVLLALIALPAIWWLVRALPPTPRREAFPPIALLRSLERSEPPPARTPLWLLLLRLALAALIILALAGPVLNPQTRIEGRGPLLLVVDNGWQAAARWQPRLALLDRLVAEAAREDRSVILLPTAPPLGGWRKAERERLPAPRPAEDVARGLLGFSPTPFAPEHAVAAARLNAATALEPSAIAWISDGLAHDGHGLLEETLRAIAPLRVYADDAAAPPLALLPVEQAGLDFLVSLRRPERGFPQAETVRALGPDGRRLADAGARFEAGSDTATARLSLPQRLRNEVARIEIAGETSAGAAALLDARSGRPLVGMFGGDSGGGVEPLRSPRYYLERALGPYAELKAGEPSSLIGEDVNAMILADVGRLAPEAERALSDWVEDGGLLIRFAGPRMAAGTDRLVPTALRSGDRSFGGTLSWEEPQRLDSFADSGPFAGLQPTQDVTVERQLLAVPAPDLAEKTWARLEDGTPLVTGANRGRGWLVLVHTTANANWSDLALSGLYVDMLRRLLTLAKTPAALAPVGEDAALLAPRALMDAFGALAPARADIAPIPARRFAQAMAAPMTPPGLYGPQASPLALNLMSPDGPIDGDFRFIEADRATTPIAAGARGERDLRPWLFSIAALLALTDFLASFLMRGLVFGAGSRRKAPATETKNIPAKAAAIGTVGAALALLAGAGTAEAQAGGALAERFAVEATSDTRIAYIETGDPGIDRVSRAGLRGLGRMLEIRTAVRLGSPMGLDPEDDGLALFPLVYWPVPEDAQALAPAARDNLARFIRSGGIVLFDAGVGDVAVRSGGIENPMARTALARLLGSLDLPPLEPVDRDHVLARSFYLLDEFPGRITGRQVWVERGSNGEEAEVSAVVIGAHDWRSAWAIDERSRFLVPNLAGGPEQREMAFRFGINLAMYALTGTYKADQLHLPAMLERLGE